MRATPVDEANRLDALCSGGTPVAGVREQDWYRPCGWLVRPGTAPAALHDRTRPAHAEGVQECTSDAPRPGHLIPRAASGSGVHTLRPATPTGSIDTAAERRGDGGAPVIGVRRRVSSTRLHALTDAVWIQHAGGSDEGLAALCAAITRATGVTMALKGRYRWVAFLPSKVRADLPVATRYFGVFADGTWKARGLAYRRHDVPVCVQRTQLAMLGMLARRRTWTACRSSSQGPSRCCWTVGMP
jgi:hypothetical protein